MEKEQREMGRVSPPSWGKKKPPKGEVGMGGAWTEREASHVGRLKWSKCRQHSQHVESAEQIHVHKKTRG